MALAGVTSKIPVDQVIDAMKEVGDKMDVTFGKQELAVWQEHRRGRKCPND